jgi:hypothetical protein
MGIVEELLAARRLDQMQALREQAPLTDADRAAVDRAVKLVNQEWTTKKRDLYQAGVSERDRQHNGLLQEVDALEDAALDLKAAVEDGRITAAEARGQLRNIQIKHGILTKQHGSLDASEEKLSARYDQTPADFQNEFLNRFPVAVEFAPTLGQVVAENEARLRDEF